MGKGNAGGSGYAPTLFPFPVFHFPVPSAPSSISLFPLPLSPPFVTLRH